MGKGWARVLVLAGLGLPWLSFPVPAKSAEVTFGGDRDYPPHHYLQEDGAPAGFDVELFRAISRQAGFTPRFELGDWGRTLTRLRDGEVDVVPMFISDSRREVYDFTRPFVSQYHLIFGRKGASHVDDVAALAGKEVILQRDGFAAVTLAEMGIPVIPILTDSEPEAMRLLAAGAHDYAVVPQFIGRFAIRRFGIENLTVSGPPIFIQQYAFAVPKGADALRGRLDTGLATLQESGEFEQIYVDWLANLQPPAELRGRLLRIALGVGLAFIAVVSVLLGASRNLRRRVQEQAERIRSEFRRRMEAEKRAQFLAYHDAVTGLPNRNRFIADLDLAVARVEARTGLSTAVVCIHVENLGQINQLAGYEVGEELLKGIAQRLASHYGQRVGFLPPDRFVVRLENPGDVDEVGREARKLLHLTSGRWRAGGAAFELLCRGGVAMLPDHAASGLELLRNAELALEHCITMKLDIVHYESKFEPDPKNVSLLADLPRAVKEGQLQLYCQPKLDLKLRAITGAEVLIRWQHPRHGLISPYVFVPLAEQSGFIKVITWHVIERLRDYLESGAVPTDPFHFSVNISANDLAEPDFAATLKSTLGRHVQRVICEITETAAIRDPNAVLLAAAELRRNGTRLSIDDYGTGYSSLVYLRELQPAEIKIDRLFVTELLQSENDRIVDESTIHMAHELGLSVTAEGAEDIETILELAHMGCDLVQGFGLARPMPIGEFAAWVAAFDAEKFLLVTTK